MGYVISRQETRFRRTWLVQEHPEAWGDRRYAVCYLKLGDAKHVQRRMKEPAFVENIKVPRFNLRVFLFGNPAKLASGQKPITAARPTANAA